jgi:hypothetical protein
LVCKEIDDKEKEKLIVGGGGSIQRKKERIGENVNPRKQC